MKLFIWDDPWHVVFGRSFIMVMAETVEDARLILRARGYCDYCTTDARHFSNREPNEVITAPGYAVREWSE